MLYPQRNSKRQFIDLSGIWDFRFDSGDKGVGENWACGFINGDPIAVPASWNDQFAEERDFLGPAWYQLKFRRPRDWENEKIMIRFGSNSFQNKWTNYMKNIVNQLF